MSEAEQDALLDRMEARRRLQINRAVIALACAAAGVVVMALSTGRLLP
jgi:hypothetical protein